MTETKVDKITCYACSKELKIESHARILKNDECDYCYADLHCCRMCEYYSPSSYNECREPSAERIVEKEKANYCDFYVLNGRAVDKEEEKNNLNAAADSLFKD